MPKNPHAVALGRLGGQKGGKARARVLSPERRREIAQKAIRTRWASSLRIWPATSRAKRCTKARSISESVGADPSDVEHILFNLSIPPLERLARSLQRGSLKNLAIHQS
jgi:hypothetical protein